MSLRFLIRCLIGLTVIVGTTGVAAAIIFWPTLNDGDRVVNEAAAGELEWTVEDAKAFRDFSLYWLGESFNGLPLERIIRYKYQPDSELSPSRAENMVLFIYGTCVPEPQACAPPLSIRVEPHCMRPPGQIASEVKDGPPVQVRGVDAQPIGGTHIRMWTGDVSIAIYTSDYAAGIDAAASLSSVSDTSIAQSDSFPPPEGNC